MNYLFLDTERTGKDLSKSSLVEIGAFFVNSALEKKNKFHAIVRQPSAIWEEGAMAMHLNSGLLAKTLEDSAQDEKSVIANFKSFVENYTSTQEDKRVFLTGTSVWTDRVFLERSWKELSLDDLFKTHQIIDITSFLRVSEDQAERDIKALMPERGLLYSSHRAMDDANYAYDLFCALIKKGVIKKP